MGLFTKKKRDPPSATGPGVSASRTTSAPASTTLALPSESSAPSPTESSFSSTFSRPHKTSTSSSRFGNPFRSSASPGSSNSPSHLHGDSPSRNGGVRSAGSLSPASGGASARGGGGDGSAGSIASSSRRDISTRQSGWDDAGVPTPDLPRGRNSPALEPLDRYRLFGGKASSSTVSLPLFVRDDSEPRQRQTSAATAAVVEKGSQRDDEQAASGGSKWSRWKLGRGAKQRSGSISSVRALSGEGLGFSGGADDGGFVVKSFRTVSRVHEDPISSGPYQSSPPATSPPLPALPLSAPILDHHGDAYQQESLRTSVDYSTSGHPRRPALNSRSPASAASPPLSVSPSASGGWRDVADRAPSPSTISVEAFRLASARSRSSVSLHSLASVGDPTSPTLGNEPRPRFEPVQRPSSRMSRRGSSYSDIGIGSSSFLPPRPAFAHDGNGSSSSIHSRASSVASIGSFMLGNGGQPQPGQGQQVDAGRAGVGLSNSESFASAASFTTAPTATSSRITSPTKPSPPPAASQLHPIRPANPKRASSGDSDLRWIASYAESSTSSSPATSPVVLKSIALPPSSPPALGTPKKNTPRSDISGTPASTASLTPTTSRLAALSGTPSFAVQPPTPVAIPGFSASSKDSQLPQRNPKRSSSLIPSSTQSALQAAGVGPPRRMSVGALPTSTSSSAGKGKAKAFPASRGWTSDTSDEDEEEALTTDSDEANSDSDDEVPLATIKSRSQTDLTLPALQAQRGGKEVQQGSPYSRLGAGATDVKAGSPLGRRGSNRRSVSTLSFSTAALATPSSGAVSSSSATPSIPPSQTRSILRPPYQARSASTPNSPVPPFLSPTSSPSLSPAPTSPTSVSGASAYTLPPAVAANSSSSSSGSGSGSGTGSTSSAVLTPIDLSPAVSDLGLKGFPSNLSAGPKPSVKFDLASLASNGAETTRWNQGRRMSALPAGSSANSVVGGGPGGLYPPSLPAHRSTPSLPTFAANSARSAVGAKSALNQSLLHPDSAIGTSPSAASLAPSSKTAASSTAGSAKGTVHDRMKARHKAEALQAMQIGSDLNNPSGMVPDEEDDDENEPLASLPTRLGGGGSMIGGEGSMSMMGGMPGMMGGMPMGMGVGFGGAYSPLAVAPPGVDPYLYASLPPDQKMSLHQRSQQMMAMMAQAALHARAESVMAGSAIGGYGGGGDSMLNGGGSMRGGPAAGHMRGTMSMGNLDRLGGYGSPGGGFDQFGMLGGHAPQQQQQQQFNAHSHLPPFAPSFAMSQAFMQHGMTAHAPSPSLYAMPAYAGSAIGFPTGGMGMGPASMMGMPSSGGGRKDRGVRAASTIGLGQRR